MSRRARTLGLTAVVVAAVGVLALVGLAPSKSLGRKAPALPREQLSGAHLTLGKLLSSANGRPSLVVFWASWCGPCTQEAPALERFSRSAEGRGRIVGVDWSDRRGSALAFIRRFGWSFPTLRDGEGTVGNDYEMTGLPEVFVLDRSGHIKTELHGPQTQASLTHALSTVEAS
jgi:cytochrome c biogenesis protein CcmG, thiol:disulfide interchange protein DsbE